MSIFSRIFRPKANTGIIGTLEELLRGSESASGATVNETTAMKVGAFFACVRVLTESIASLPFEVYRRKDRSKERATDLLLYRLVHTQPNIWQTSFEFRELAVYNVIMRGNHFSLIDRDRQGRVSALVPLNPDKMKVDQTETGALSYRYTTDRGEALLSPSEIWHIRGLSVDGFTGISVLTWAREVLGGAISIQDFGSRVWRNSANPAGVLKHPKTLSDDAQKRLKQQFEERYSGSPNAGRTMVLEEGMDFARVSMSLVDAQFLENRKLTRADIAGIMRVPPHMIGDLERATFSNIEHQDIAFSKHSIRPWCVRIEQSLQRDVIRTEDIFAELNVDGLARGDLKSRYDAYAVGRNWGWLSVNDIRARENMNPIEDGDEYLRPLNMSPVGEDAREGERDPVQDQGEQHENVV